jgi:hypothetical protein
MRSSEKVGVPALSEILLIFHRHPDCLLESTPHVAISHVRNPDVAVLEYNSALATESIDPIVIELLEEPGRICKALATIDEHARIPIASLVRLALRYAFSSASCHANRL